jgi:hypothetical protein
VRKIVGRSAEALAYLFCVIDRGELWKQAANCKSPNAGFDVSSALSKRKIHLTAVQARELLIIETANLAEQCAAEDGSPSDWMWLPASWARVMNSHGVPVNFNSSELTRSADRKVVREYRRLSSTSVSEISPVLDAISRINPWAAEIRLLRAINALDHGRKEQAFLEATQAHALFSSWAVAWDKRLALWEWTRLTEAVIAAALTPAHGPTGKLSLSKVLAVLSARSNGHRHKAKLSSVLE